MSHSQQELPVPDPELEAITEFRQGGNINFGWAHYCDTESPLTLKLMTPEDDNGIPSSRWLATCKYFKPSALEQSSQCVQHAKPMLNKETYAQCYKSKEVAHATMYQDFKRFLQSKFIAILGPDIISVENCKRSMVDHRSLPNKDIPTKKKRLRISITNEQAFRDKKKRQLELTKANCIKSIEKKVKINDRIHKLNNWRESLKKYFNYASKPQLDTVDHVTAIEMCTLAAGDEGEGQEVGDGEIDQDHDHEQEISSLSAANLVVDFSNTNSAAIPSNVASHSSIYIHDTQQFNQFECASLTNKGRKQLKLKIRCVFMLIIEQLRLLRQLKDLLDKVDMSSPRWPSMRKYNLSTAIKIVRDKWTDSTVILVHPKVPSKRSMHRFWMNWSKDESFNVSKPGPKKRTDKKTDKTMHS